MTYTTHRNTQATLAIIDNLDLDTEKTSREDIMKKFGYDEQMRNGKLSFWQNLKPTLWALFEEPNSSIFAKVVATLMYHLETYDA